MKQLKITAFLVTLAVVIVSFTGLPARKKGVPPKLESYKGYAISFYNVENLFDTIDDPATADEDFIPSGKLKWNTERYLLKLDHLVEALTLNQPKNPMLIGLVEVENAAVVKDLAGTGRFAETDYRLAHKESPDTRGIDCALLYDAKRFHPKVIANLAVTLDSVPDFKTRDILYVQGELIGGKTLHVFVNHWPSRRGGEEKSVHKRKRAAEVARQKIDEILKNDPKANILLMGDFNDHPTDESVEKVLGAKPVTDKTAQLVNLLYDDQVAGKGTHNYQNQWGVLDQFIVSSAFFKGKGGIKIRGRDAMIVFEDKLMYIREDGTKKPSTTYGGPNYYGGYSDHLPITLYLK